MPATTSATPAATSVVEVHVGRAGDLVGELLDVVALVAVLGRLLAARPRADRLGQAADLAALVVEVVLALDRVAGEREDPPERVAVGGVAAARGGQRAGRVGRDELEVHALGRARASGRRRRRRRRGPSRRPPRTRRRRGTGSGSRGPRPRRGRARRRGARRARRPGARRRRAAARRRRARARARRSSRSRRGRPAWAARASGASAASRRWPARRPPPRRRRAAAAIGVTCAPSSRLGANSSSRRSIVRPVPIAMTTSPACRTVSTEGWGWNWPDDVAHPDDDRTSADVPDRLALPRRPRRDLDLLHPVLGRDLERAADLRVQRQARHLRAARLVRRDHARRAGAQELGLDRLVGRPRDDRDVGPQAAHRERDEDVVGVGVHARDDAAGAHHAGRAQDLVVGRLALDEAHADRPARGRASPGCGRRRRSGRPRRAGRGRPGGRRGRSRR